MATREHPPDIGASAHGGGSGGVGIAAGVGAGQPVHLGANDAELERRQ